MSSLGEESSVLSDGPLIWAIDDEPGTLELIEALLAEGGYTFRGFLNPCDAFDALDDLNQRAPALLLLDLMLPSLHGVEFLRLLRQRERGVHIPVIVITALTSDSSLLNAFEAGADDLIRKPFSVAELAARIERQVARQRQVALLRRAQEDTHALATLTRQLNQRRALDALWPTLIAALHARAPHHTQAAFYLLRRDGLLRLASPPVAALPAQLETGRAPHLAAALARYERASLREEDARALGLPPAYACALWPLSDGRELLGALLVCGPLANVEPQEHAGRFISAVVELAALAVQRELRRHGERPRVDRTTSLTADLVRSRDFLTNLIDSSPNAIVAAARDGAILIFNTAAERILGWPREVALGMDVRALYAPGVAQQIMRRLRAQEEGGVGRLEGGRESLRDRDARLIPVDISAALIYDERGREVGSVGVFTDLRQHIQMERQLQQANADLEATRQQVMMAELAGATAHELNQPLTSLLNYADLLSQLELPMHERAQRAIDTISQEAQRIADIVRRLGQITQYRTRGYVGQARIVDLRSPPDDGAP